jgi:ketosteroid isomerase-like protein
MDSRVSLYGDDLVLFVAPIMRDLKMVKAALAIFSLASGLFSNLDKSIAMPMHCSEPDVAWVRDILSCRIEEFPCRYL